MVKYDDSFSRDGRFLARAIWGSMVLHALALGALRFVEPLQPLRPTPQIVSRFAELKPIEVVDEIPTVTLGGSFAQPESAALPPEVESDEAPAAAPEPEPESEPTEPESKAPPAPVVKEPEDISAKSDTPIAPLQSPQNELADASATPSSVSSLSGSSGGGTAPSTPASVASTGGSGVRASSGAPAGVDKNALRRGYLGQLGLRVNQKYYYPKIAQRLGQQGRVLVAIEIDAQGRIIRVSIHQKCEHERLNEAALRALQKLKSVPPPPPALLVRGRLRVIVPMVYAL